MGISGSRLLFHACAGLLLYTCTSKKDLYKNKKFV